MAVMLSEALHRNAKYEVRLSNISDCLHWGSDLEKSEMESLASRTSSATLQLRFAQNDIFEKASRLNEVNYEVIARKYRPQTFDDLVGQAHVTRTLKNAVEQNRLAHAYLFVGPRGIGKTSTARILAADVRRSGRPGTCHAHAQECGRAEPTGPCVPLRRATRNRKDIHRAHPGRRRSTIWSARHMSRARSRMRSSRTDWPMRTSSSGHAESERHPPRASWPQTFDDLVGQAHVTRTLKNAVEQNRLAHAYLFVGPRGIGKTSTARILAKALNCVNGPTVTPCGVCDSCKEITAGNSLDVLEIDGASNNGVEQVRELRDNVRYAPTKGKFKIYIIDEVHMLTSAAFNALLKTLEEPPPHVKFIFATTEPQKVLPTILSRCQRFDLHRIPANLIAKHLQFIADKEEITLDPAAAHAIARG